MSDHCRLILGDSLDVMREMESGSVDAVVADPPSSMGFMNKCWDKDKGGRAQWCGWLGERMAEALRLAKPGSYALVWAIPRRSHWTALALEDAGWEISDRLASICGQGFPKHKSKLKPAIEDWWLCRRPAPKATMLQIDRCRVGFTGAEDQRSATPQGRCTSKSSNSGFAVAPVAATDHDGTERIEFSRPDNSAGRWPSHCVLIHSAGCVRVGTKRVKTVSWKKTEATATWGTLGTKVGPHYADPDGLETVEEWQCVDGCPIAELDCQSGLLRARGNRAPTKRQSSNGVWAENGSAFGTGPDGPIDPGDSGGASRFFNTFAFEADDFAPFRYCGKASRRERDAGLDEIPERSCGMMEDDHYIWPDGRATVGKNHHPTVKPLALMRWLCRLITPLGGLILDPFAGSGTTLLAAHAEGFTALGIESDPDYYAIAERRIAAARSATPLFEGTT